MISVKAKYNETKEITVFHKMVIEALFEGKNSNHCVRCDFCCRLVFLRHCLKYRTVTSQHLKLYHCRDDRFNSYDVYLLCCTPWLSFIFSAANIGDYDIQDVPLVIFCSVSEIRHTQVWWYVENWLYGSALYYISQCYVSFRSWM